MGTLRKPLFVVALVVIAIAVLAELGSLGLIKGATLPTSSVSDILPDGAVKDAYDGLDSDQSEEFNSISNKDKPPGFAVTYLAFIDGMLLFIVGLIGASLIIPERIHGRIQGVATLIFTILMIIAAIAGAFIALAAVILMVALLLAFPFGTLVYLAKFGFFNKGGAAGILAFVMLMKIIFAVALILSQQRFLQNIGLVLLIITSFVANIIVGFLHGFVPGFLVSITDAVAAIVLAIIGIIWAIIFLIGSIISIITSIRAKA